MLKMLEQQLSIYVVIPASGLGLRCKSDLPKQFHYINGRPVISHTILAFERIEIVKSIIVTTPPADDLNKKMKDLILHWHHQKVVLTKGGDCRHRSILNGLKCLKGFLEKNQMNESCKDPVVIIHDGVRPFVDKQTICDIAAAALKYNAVGIMRPLVSTVISVDKNNFLKCALDRSIHWASEMPQAFLLSIIYQAYLKCTEDELKNGTECLKIVADHIGVKAKILYGNENLWKVTYNKDLIAAQHLLNNYLFRRKTVVVQLRSKENQFCAQEIFNKSLLQGECEIVSAEEIDDEIKKNLASNNILIANNLIDIENSLTCMLKQIVSHDIIDSSFRVLVAIICLHMDSDHDNNICCCSFRSHLQKLSEEYFRKNILLHGLVLKSGHENDVAKSCLKKLMENANLELTGQVFFF